MKKIILKKKMHNTQKSLPKKHAFTAICLLVLTSAAAVFIPSTDATATRSVLQLPVELVDASPLEPIPVESIEKVEPINDFSSSSVEPEKQLAEPVSTEQPWEALKVKSGDSLSTLFKRAKLSAQELYHFTHSSKEARQFAQIFPGQTIEVQKDNEQRLLAIRYVESELQSTLFQREQDDTFSAHNFHRTPDVVHRYRQATIQDSLFLAGQRAGLPQKLIMEMANIFGGVIDFVYDPRKGDEFHILYEELYLDGNKIGTGNILAAQYTNQGETYSAFRYVYENGDIGYYTPEGISMRKAFLRAPLDFTRISSGFNPNRKHPIHKKIKAHRGIDYAAPRGTPIFAAGDGRVAKAGYSQANGNFVVIQHGQQYTTKYLHLDKRYVKSGQKVKQQQIIGTVGSTGYATGPHLHYEFLVSGVHRNPRTILKKLPKADSIAKSEKPRFLAQTRGIQLQLASYSGNTELALLNTAE